MLKQDFLPSAKGDFGINFILATPENELRRLKSVEIDGFKRHLAELKSLRLAAEDMQKPKEERESLRKERLKKLASPPSPLTKSLCFPDMATDPWSRKPMEQPFVSALLRGNLTPEECAAIGAKPRSQVKNIFTVDIELSKLQDVLDHPAVEYVELSRDWRPDLGDAVPFAGIDTLQAAPHNLTGQGVIVGVLDEYLDIYHPDFRKDDGAGGDGLGSTRVLYYWDQVLTPIAGENPPPVDPVLPGFNFKDGFSYGVEYDQATINAELNAYTPATPNAYGITRFYASAGSHGTAVASCASGNGRGSGLTGAAPQAEMIHVNNAYWDDTQAVYVNIDKGCYLDGIAYIFARASQLGKPCVVNLSSSDNMGPHDGTTLGEQFLDGLLDTPGRVITCSAGNTGVLAETYSGSVESAVPSVFELVCTGNGIEDGFIEIWYDGTDRFEFQLDFPDSNGGMATLKVSPGHSKSYTMANGIVVDVISSLHDARNGDNVITIMITGVGYPNFIPIGTFTMTLFSPSVVNGKFHAWVDRNNRGTRYFAFSAEQYQIAVPATAYRTISVGNHLKVAQGAVPLMSPVSSDGPSRDQRSKPTISTVGTDVVMAYARNMNSLPLASMITEPADGTSFSAPIVAGVCALIFEKHGGHLNWYDVSQILMEASGALPIGDGTYKYLQCGTIPNISGADVDVWLQDDVSDTGVEPFAGPIWWESPDINLFDTNLVATTTVAYNGFTPCPNVLEITSRIAGTQSARNLKYSVYWKTAIALGQKTDWQDEQFFVNRESPHDSEIELLRESSNFLFRTIQEQSTPSQHVRFGWSPQVKPGLIPLGFAIKAVLSVNADEPIDPQKSKSVKLDNNIALRLFTNVALSPAVLPRPSELEGFTTLNELLFPIMGAGDQPVKLSVMAQDLEGKLRISIPASSIPVYDAGWHKKFGVRKPGLTKALAAVLDWISRLDHKWKGEEITRRCGIKGASHARLKKGVLELEVDLKPNHVLQFPTLFAPEAEPIPFKVQLLTNKAAGPKSGLHFLHQHADGEEMGMFIRQK